MASLRSMILDGRKAPLGPCSDPKAYLRSFDITQKALQSPDTVLVNITPLVLELFETRQRTPDPSWNQHQLIPDPKPPYRTMWLESYKEDVHFGELVRRFDIKDAVHLEAYFKDSRFEYLPKYVDEIRALTRPTIVEAAVWAGFRGHVDAAGDLAFWLNSEGEYQEGQVFPFEPAPEGFVFTKEASSKPEFAKYVRDIQLIYITEHTVLHTFARMNCHNVKLAPMAGSVAKPNGKKPPSSVWHEIVVTSIAQLRREQKGAVAPEGEKRVMRFHNIRGHYADYTKGNGLFGNPKLKKRFWVPEHTAGDPELGTVVSSYKVK